MTSEIDIMKKVLSEYDRAVKLKRLNQELCDHLFGSIVWLLKYSDKYTIPLPKKEELNVMVKRTESFIDRISEIASQPKLKHPFTTPEDETEPKFLMI